MEMRTYFVFWTLARSVQSMEGTSAICLNHFLYILQWNVLIMSMCVLRKYESFFTLYLNFVVLTRCFPFGSDTFDKEHW